MSDWADRASEHEQQMRDDALAKRAHQSAKRQVEASAEDCAVCGNPIPEKRRAALPGVQTCIYCQRELEQGLKTMWRTGG